MKLSAFIIMISLAVAVATWPSEHNEGSDSETKLNAGLGPYALAARGEKGKRDSIELGKPCRLHCECIGATVLCGTVYVGGIETYKCISKRHSNPILDAIAQAENAVIKAASSFRCE